MISKVRALTLYVGLVVTVWLVRQGNDATWEARDGSCRGERDGKQWMSVGRRNRLKQAFEAGMRLASDVSTFPIRASSRPRLYSPNYMARIRGTKLYKSLSFPVDRCSLLMSMAKSINPCAPTPR